METYLSGYKLMWMLVMFDLPVMTKKERREATKFRDFLLDSGFTMMQFSVYIKSSSGREMNEKYKRSIEANVPPHGIVNILEFTDKQYGDMKVFFGGKRKKVIMPEQYVLYENSIEDFIEEETA